MNDMHPLDQNELQNRLNLAMKGFGLGAWEYDVLDSRLTWDTEVRDFYGFSPEDPISVEAWIACVFVEDRDMVRARFAEMLQGNPVNVFEFRILRKSDGTERVLETTGVVQCQADGGPVRVLGMSRDVTEVFYSRKAVSESNRRYLEFVGALEGVMWEARVNLVSENFDFQFVSHAFKRITGLTPGEVVRDSRKWFDLIHPEDRESVIRGYFCNGGDHKVLKREFRLRIAPDEVIWVEEIVHAKVLDDKVVDLRGLVVDVSRRKESERRLLDQQAYLAASAKMASLGEMAGGVAHEINNPLAIILGKCRTLSQWIGLEAHSAEELLSEVNVIEQTVRRIDVIVKGLKNFSRDSEKESVQIVSMVEVVRDALGLCQERFRNHGIRLSVDPAIESSPPILIRRVQLGQVLLNLLNNAFDAVQENETEREKEVVIRFGNRGSTLLLMVEDSGPGVSMQYREKIMQPFFTTKPLGKGTGLGLSISKGIVEANGGALYLDPHSARTRFVIEVPVGGLDTIQEAQRETTKRSTLRAKEPSGPGVLSGLRVLVVDDEEHLRMILADELVLRGAEVMLAMNGIEAQKLITTGRCFHLVISDVRMPEMDGIELAMEVNRHVHPKPGFFLISGYNEISEEKARSIGVDRIFPKPFEFDRILEGAAYYTPKRLKSGA